MDKSKTRNSEKAKPTTQQLQALWDAVIEWREEHAVSCAEAITQIESVNLALPDLAEQVLDITGYWDE